MKNNYCSHPDCGTVIRFLKHKTTGKFAPIELEPGDNGNILVKGDLYRIATPEERKKAKIAGVPLFKNHFFTCKFAQSFKKKKKLSEVIDVENVEQNILPVPELSPAQIKNINEKFEAIDRKNRNNILVHTWNDGEPLTLPETRTGLAKK